MGSDKLFHKKKLRSSKELARHKEKKSPYETILIICEDSKSSYYYFNELIKSLRLNAANVVTVPSRGSTPISVVEHSIEIVKNSPYMR